MTHYKNILFDLDGTLVDSGEGILKCAALALETLGKPMPSPAQMRTFVGPPLVDSFMRFGCSAEEAEEAVRIYRSRYTVTGKYEGFVYPGIKALLQQLHVDGCRLFVATSKPEATAIDVLTKFGLAPYFERIIGATFDRSRSTKSEVIAYLLESVGDMDHVLMVGDTAFDVIGATAHRLPTAAVSWGYGDVQEMITAGAACIVDTTEQLYRFIKEGA